MTIMRGTSASYYRCADRAKRGICDNALSVREEVARSCLFRAIHDALFSAENLNYLRQQIAERLGELARTATAELRERTERIARTKERLDNIVAFVAQGNRSKTMGAAINDLEAQLEADGAALAALKEQAAAPAAVPTPEAILWRAQDLDRVLTRLRQERLRFFERGQILLHPQADGTYIAMSTLLPLVVLAQTNAHDRWDSAREAAARHWSTRFAEPDDAATLARLDPALEAWRPCALVIVDGANVVRGGARLTVHCEFRRLAGDRFIQALSLRPSRRCAKATLHLFDLALSTPELEVYLADLGDKTLPGQEGRARAGWT